MNTNRIFTNGFSNPDTRQVYQTKGYIDGRLQCGGCSFYAIFNCDWGLCCHSKSAFYLETVFEHFGCEKHVPESWESHSFTGNPNLLIDRSRLIDFLRACVRAIDGKKGIGVVSRDVRRLYLEMKQLLARWEEAEQSQIARKRHR
jgi:hypothetical protein